MTDPQETVPEQHGGVEVNVEDSVLLPGEAEAKTFYHTVRQRLLQVNEWGTIAGALSAHFELTDAQGQPTGTPPQKGNFFKIDIPAPGIVSGEGYDWVRIEEVLEENGPQSSYVSLRVRPAPSPLNDKEDVAHFYTDEATSNFIVKCEGNTVTAGVYGRNEKPNVSEVHTVIDKVRNALVGTGGVSGFSKLQWKALVSGLLAR